MEVNKEKLILGLAVLAELITSALVYLVRHSMWHSLTSDHLLVLYAIRCQLTVTVTVLLVFGPKVSVRHWENYAAGVCGYAACCFGLATRRGWLMMMMI